MRMVCIAVGQHIDPLTAMIENVIEYGPTKWNPLVSFFGAETDRVQQRVLLSYKRSGKQYSLLFKGTAIRLQRVLGVNLRSQQPLTLMPPLELPFGSFELLYIDNELRIVKTQQGFYALNQKMQSGQGWD